MTIKNSPLLVTAVLAIACTGQATANSCPVGTSARAVEGKIFDQLTITGTLGVVHLQVGEKTKVKCGMAGSGGVGPYGAILYEHSLVCDDSVQSANGDSIHSQITLNTTGTSALQACGSQPGFQGTFREVSVPEPASGRGMFHGVQGGRIVIDGTINCGQAINAKFSGYFCAPGQ